MKIAAIIVAVAVGAISIGLLEPMPWTNPTYLYRYVVWGARHLGPHVTDYERFPFRVIENAAPAWNFDREPADAIPATVEYNEAGAAKRVTLDELLRSTETHAFIVISHGQLVYEEYFQGYHRDSLNFSASMA